LKGPNKIRNAQWTQQWSDCLGQLKSPLDKYNTKQNHVKTRMEEFLKLAHDSGHNSGDKVEYGIFMW
jgi:hypothetical protein